MCIFQFHVRVLILSLKISNTYAPYPSLMRVLRALPIINTCLTRLRAFTLITRRLARLSPVVLQYRCLATNTFVTVGPHVEKSNIDAHFQF